MSINNIIKFDTARKETEELLKKNFEKFKSKASSSMDMKPYALNSNKYPSSYDQPSSDLIKLPLLKSPTFHSRASQPTKHLSFINL